MSQYKTYVCNIGAYEGPDKDTACICKHTKADHYFGGGECGECRCAYYRPLLGSSK